MNGKKLWVIGIALEEDIVIRKFTGTDSEVEQKLLDLVSEDKKDHEDTWVEGTDCVENIFCFDIKNVVPSREFHAFGKYENFTILYKAIPFEVISEI